MHYFLKVSSETTFAFLALCYMKQVLLILVITLLSCTKQVEKPGSQCWSCQVRQMDGEYKTQDGCGPIPGFTDNNGNSLSSFCHDK